MQIQVTQPTPDSESLTITGIPAGRGQAVAKLLTDLEAAAAAKGMNFVEDFQAVDDLQQVF